MKQHIHVPQHIAALLVLCLSAATSVSGMKNPEMTAKYEGAFKLVRSADQYRQQGKFADASNTYAQALASLEEIQAKAPEWQSDIVRFRIDYCRKFMTGNSQPSRDPETSIRGDRFDVDRHTNAICVGHCILSCSSYTLYASTIQMVHAEAVLAPKDVGIHAYDAVRICIAPQSATGETIVAVSTEAHIRSCSSNMVELSGVPSPVLHRGGKYLRAQRITYAIDTGAWQFDPAPESSTEPPQDMRDLFILPTNATTTVRRP